MKYIGIDNGVSGSIAIIESSGIKYFPIPTKSELSYTKTKQYITRVDVNKLRGILDSCVPQDSKCLLERPMVNPGRFKATASALRALEATLIILEELKIPFQYIDSKEWQKALLPHGIEKEELKKASLDIARRLFPALDYTKMKDGDSLLIAEYCRRENSELPRIGVEEGE